MVMFSLLFVCLSPIPVFAPPIPLFAWTDRRVTNWFCNVLYCIVCLLATLQNGFA